MKKVKIHLPKPANRVVYIFHAPSPAFHMHMFIKFLMVETVCVLGNCRTGLLSAWPAGGPGYERQ